MELLRDLIRDLVGILFPGGLFVFFTAWFLWGVLILFGSEDVLNIFLTGNDFVVSFMLIIISYIAGQSLRLKRLDDIEKRCTNKYRKKRVARYLEKYAGECKRKNGGCVRLQVGKCIGKLVAEYSDKDSLKYEEKLIPRLKAMIKRVWNRFKRNRWGNESITEYVYAMKEEFNESRKQLDDNEEEYYRKAMSLEDLTDKYKRHNYIYGIWEEFPYPYQLRGRRLDRQSADYNDFFEKYDRQHVTRTQTFFHFCKSVAYQHSPPFREELIHQESLVRLFAGIYYVSVYGWVTSLIVAVFHGFALLKVPFPSQNTDDSGGIVLVSVLIFWILLYLRNEILSRLRFMRVKEIRLAYDGFYLISKEKDYDL